MGIFDKMKSKSGTKPVAKKEAKEPKEKDAKAAKAKADKAPVSEEAKKPAKKGALAKDDAGQAYRILVSPVFTEKAAMLQGAGKYVFVVAKDSTKVSVAAAIRDLYGVKPVSVRIVKVPGKNVRFGRFSGKEKDVKKAIVSLKKGDSIAVME